MATPLEELIVEFVTKGADALKEQMEKIQQKSDLVAKSLDSIGDEQLRKVAAASAALAKQQQQLAQAMSRMMLIAEKGKVFGNLAYLGQKYSTELRTMSTMALGATAAISGFVIAGFRASAFGQIFSFQMERLSRIIGGLFKPEMQAIVNFMERLIDKLSNLTAKQRESIAMWVKFAASVKLVSFAFSGLLKAMGPIAQILTVIAAAFALANSHNSEFAESFKVLAEGIGSVIAALGEVLMPILEVLGEVFKALAPVLSAIFKVIATVLKVIAAIVKFIIGAIVKLIKVLTFGLVDLEKKKKDAAKKEDRSELGKRASGFEDIAGTFERFAQTSIAIGGTNKDAIAQQQLNIQKSMNAHLKKIASGGRPLVRGGPGGTP